MISYDKYSSQQETLEKIKKEEKKETKVEFPEIISGRKPVIWLFAGTILLSLFFWLRGGALKDLHLFSSEKITFEKRKEPEAIWTFDSQEKLVEALVKETEELAGTYGIYVQELKSGKEFGLNLDKKLPAASVNKLPIVFYFYKRVNEGAFKLSDQYTLEAADVQDYGTGSMRYDSPGTVYTYADLVKLSLKKSDNTAAYVLVKILGKEKIQTWLNKMGLTQTSIEENTATPQEAGQLLVRFYQGKIVGEKEKEAVLEMMTKTDSEDRIPKLLPSDLKVAHKIGNEVGVINDCGIVFEKKPYVICILTENAREDEAVEMLPKLSRMVWEWERKK